MAVTRLSLDVPEPFGFELTVRKPAGWHWGTPNEIYERGVLYSAVRIPGGRLAGVELKETGKGHVAVRAFTRSKLSDGERRNLLALLELGLGVGDDLRGFYALGRKDPLVRILKRDLYGMRLGFFVDVFERCLLAITLQMTPMKRSTQMRGCLIEEYGEKVGVERRTIPYWPSAAAIAAADVNELKKKCLLGYRAKAIHKVAEAITSGFPDILELSRMSDTEITRQLRSLYGIGSYSAQIISPHRGFPLDSWSARIFHEIMHGKTPDDPRRSISELGAEAEARWGKYKGHVFVYVLNDLPNLLGRYPISKMS